MQRELYMSISHHTNLSPEGGGCIHKQDTIFFLKQQGKKITNIELLLIFLGIFYFPKM